MTKDEEIVLGRVFARMIREEGVSVYVDTLEPGSQMTIDGTLWGVTPYEKIVIERVAKS